MALGCTSLVKGWYSLRFPNPSAKIISPLYITATLIPGTPFLILAASKIALSPERSILTDGSEGEVADGGGGICMLKGRVGKCRGNEIVVDFFFF